MSRLITGKDIVSVEDANDHTRRCLFGSLSVLYHDIQTQTQEGYIQPFSATFFFGHVLAEEAENDKKS
jgi:hypothetical protein